MDEQNKRKIESLSEYRAGMKIHGLIIKKVYFYNEDKKFIVIKAKDDNDIHVFGGDLSPIEHLLAECKFLISGLRLGIKSREMFDYQRAIAINSYLVGQTDTGKKILDALLDKLHQRKILTKKLWYIGVFLSVTVSMIIFLVFFREFTYIKYVKIATFGAIGGYISLNIKLDKIKFEISESTVSYIFVSLYKVLFAMLTSVISYFLIESNLVLGVVSSNNTKSLYFIYTIATLAGFSESLLPNIFGSIEEKQFKKDMPTTNRASQHIES